MDEALLLAQKFTMQPGRLALVAVIDSGKATLVASRSPGEGVAMGDLVAVAADLAGGRGGGSQIMARAGGLEADRLESSLDQVLRQLADGTLTGGSAGKSAGGSDGKPAPGTTSTR